MLFRKLRRIQLFCVICVAAALFAFTINKLVSIAPLLLAFGLRIYFTKLKKRYIAEVVHFSAGHTLKQHLKNAAHLKEAPLSSETLRNVHMLPCDSAANGVTVCEGGRGTYNGLEVTLTGATFVHTYQLGAKKRTNYTVGTWVCVQLPQDTGMDCRFLSVRTAPEPVLKDMLRSETALTQMSEPPAGLKNPWQAVCRKGMEQLPDIGFCKQLDKLYDLTDGHAAVCVQGNRLHIMLEDEVLAQDVSIRIKPEENIQEDLLPALSCALRLTGFLGK